MSARELWRRGQAGWPRRFPLVQLPNPPLLIALAGRRLEARAPAAGRATFAVAFGVWAWQEAAAGANWLRRALGVGALAWLARTLWRR